VAWVALAGLGLDLAAVICGRAMLSRKWPGVRFVRIEVRHWTRAELAAAVLAAAGFASSIGGLVQAATGPPGPALTSGDAVAGLGAALLVAGVALTVWSQMSMGASWRVGVDHTETTVLIRIGPYRRIRNPIHTAMILVFGAVVLLVPSLAVAAGWLFLVAFVEVQVRTVEEPLLWHQHGEEFHAWAARTGALHSRPGRDGVTGRTAGLVKRPPGASGRRRAVGSGRWLVSGCALS